MPRKPKKITPPRQIRLAIGFSQAEMATALGVSKDAVEKLENERMKMPVGLAYKYRLISGCDLHFNKDSPRLAVSVCATRHGRDYTEEVFKEYEASADSIDQVIFKTAATDILHQLIDKAVSEGTLSEFTVSFEKFIAELTHKHPFFTYIPSLKSDTHQTSNISNLL